jgi:hypothetical protein
MVRRHQHPGNEQYFRANPDATDGNYYLTSVLVYYPDIENGNTPGAKIISGLLQR